MDQEVLVTGGLYAGRRLIDALLAAGFDVSAAAWLHATDIDQWYLHIVSADVRSRGAHEAYGALHAVMGALPAVTPYPGAEVSFDLGDVRLLGADTHLAKRLADTHARHAGRTDRFVHGGPFDPFYFDSRVYLYALPAPAPAA